MSIDVHEAIKAIRDMRPIIDPEDDFLAIVAAEECIAAAEAKRKRELEEAHAAMKALAKVLEAARISSTRPASVPSVAAHAATLNELDSSRLSLAKAISDMEGLIGSREAELTALMEEAKELEEYDPAAEHRAELDGTPLRLQIYKGLGFEPVVGKDGKIEKVLVRAQSGEIHVVEAKGLQDDPEHTQRLWKLAS